MNEKENIEEKKTYDVVLEVPPDKMEAYVTIIPFVESPEVSIDDVKKVIQEKGIVFGINEDALKTFVDKEKQYEKILVASGIKPVDGKNGEIKYLVKTGETVKVSRNEKIAEILPPQDGVEGVTIFNEKIPTKNGEVVKIPKFDNIEKSKDNPNILISTMDGYLSFVGNYASIKPFFELTVSKDEYEAYITVQKPINEGDFHQEDIKKFLKDNKIVYGIKDEELENIFREKIFDQNILIASGQKVIDGKDGGIKYYFDTEIKPKMDDKGNVNYREINLIQNVKKGQKLIEVVPPLKGLEGITVFGKRIIPKEGKPYLLPIGRNNNPSPDNPGLLVASIDGHIVMKGKNIDIDPLFVVQKDVDFSTGNINFIGSVIIKGDVRSGFTVKAENDVEIQGIVEDAVIEAGGNVLIKTGFVGKGEGKIISKGKVLAKFCDNETIISEDDIVVGEYVMHCNIETKGKLIVTDQKGLIVGGEIFALKGAEAKIIGNKNYTPTKIFVGINKEIKEKIVEDKSLLMKNLENKKEIEKALIVLMRRKLVKKKIPDDKKDLLDRLVQVKEKLAEEEKKLSSEIEELQAKLADFRDAVVKVYDTIYPGTSIAIFKNQITVNEPIKQVFYKYTEKEIVAVSLSETES